MPTDRQPLAAFVCSCTGRVFTNCGCAVHDQEAASGHRSEPNSVYCRYCGAHPMWWSHRPCWKKEALDGRR